MPGSGKTSVGKALAKITNRPFYDTDDIIVNEKGIDEDTGNVLVEVDPKYFRPAEVEQLLGDPTKAKTLLGWNPTKTSFADLVKKMVRHDMKLVRKQKLNGDIDANDKE